MGTLLIQVGHAFEINLLGIFEKLFETTIKNNPWLSQKKMQFNITQWTYEKEQKDQQRSTSFAIVANKQLRVFTVKRLLPIKLKQIS
jgi:hypothetical protein